MAKERAASTKKLKVVNDHIFIFGQTIRHVSLRIVSSQWTKIHGKIHAALSLYVRSKLGITQLLLFAYVLISYQYFFQ